MFVTESGRGWSFDLSRHADPVDIPLGASTLAKKWRLEVQTNVADGTVNALMSTGASTTTITVAGVTTALPSGTVVTITSGANSQTWTLTAAATVGATTLTVASQTPNFAYPVGSTVTAQLWIKVKGIKNLVPAVATTKQDDSDYDSNGWGSQTATKLAWTVTATLARKVLAIGGNWSTGAPKAQYDPGQEALRAVAGTLGDGNTVPVRWCEMDQSVRVEAYQGNGTVDWTEAGGAMDALDDVNVVITGQGARTAITHPYPLT